MESRSTGWVRLVGIQTSTCILTDTVICVDSASGTVLPSMEEGCTITISKVRFLLSSYSLERVSVFTTVRDAWLSIILFCSSTICSHSESVNAVLAYWHEFTSGARESFLPNTGVFGAPKCYCSICCPARDSTRSSVEAYTYKSSLI